MRKFLATVEIEVEVTVNDEKVIDRVVNNEDDWRGTFYDMFTAEEVAQMLAYNFTVNGVRSVRELDGWADIEDRDAVTVNNLYHDVRAQEASVPGTGASA